MIKTYEEMRSYLLDKYFGNEITVQTLIEAVSEHDSTLKEEELTSLYIENELDIEDLMQMIFRLDVTIDELL